MNEHSPKFKLVSDYYQDGLWNEAMVNNAVGRWITEEEAKEILGKDDVNGN